jgi:hypothetical protein
MQSKKKLILALATVALMGMMVTCVDQTINNNLLKDAELLELWIGDVKIPLSDDPETEIVETTVEPINSDDWDNGEFNLASPDGFGRILFNRNTELVQQRIRATVNSTARPAQWGVGTRSTRPSGFYDTRVPITFESDDFIYIKVTAQDGVTSNYYRIYTKLLSWVTDLSTVSVAKYTGEGTRVAKAGTPSTYGIPNYWTTAQEAQLNITTAEGSDATVIAATFDPNATVEFAQATGTGDPSALFKPADVPQTFSDQDFLYVKVTAENTVDIDLYRFRVNVGRMSTIENLFFVDNDKEAEETGTGSIQIFGKGLPNADWTKVAPGSHVTADPPVAGYDIIIEPDDPDSEYEYQKIATAAAAQPTFGSAIGGIQFTQKEALAIKVTAKNADGEGSPIVTYYTVEVTLQPANIKTHPKSAWYYVNDPVTALTVELDRGDPSDYDYQWYWADSWYGIYGRNGMDVDEKNNISCVNGGPSMYFYLVEPDSTDTNSGQPWAWTLTGATDATYTPRNDWVNVDKEFNDPNKPKMPSPQTPPRVNFFDGSTSEIRYYWVKVSSKANSDLFVISDRALILTETNKGTKHFIFNLSALPKGTPRKNIVPFTTKNNDPYYGSSPYKMDLKELLKNENLNPSEYEICVAHAQYFLPDGRAWTQNWTHGDLHFGFDDNSLTWWQNNLGSNAGAVPLQTPHSSQGGLTEKPDWVGVKPSGDPDKGLPKEQWKSANGKDTNGLPKGTYPNTPSPPGGVAQGYFCGFIELLELRFATTPK